MSMKLCPASLLPYTSKFTFVLGVSIDTERKKPVVTSLISGAVIFTVCFLSDLDLLLSEFLYQYIITEQAKVLHCRRSTPVVRCTKRLHSFICETFLLYLATEIVRTIEMAK